MQTQQVDRQRINLRRELHKAAEGLADAHVGLFRSIKLADEEGRGHDWQHQLRAADAVIVDLRDRIQEVYNQLS